MSNDAVIYVIFVAACTIYTVGSFMLFFFARRAFWFAMAGVMSFGLFFVIHSAFLSLKVRAFGFAVLLMVPVLIGSFAVFTFMRCGLQRGMVRRAAPPTSVDGTNA